MPKKTNKTAHVLSLISKAKEEHNPGEAGFEMNSAKISSLSNQPFINIEVYNDKEKEIEDKIKEGLAEILDNEASPKTELEPESSWSSDKTYIKNAESIFSEDISFLVNPPENFESEEPEPSIKKPGYCYINVLEEVVKIKIDEFMKIFEVCECERCKADVTALALNGLPPKYIVVDESHVSPLLSFFSNQYKSQVSAQLSRACMVVKENPHH